MVKCPLPVADWTRFDHKPFNYSLTLNMQTELFVEKRNDIKSFRYTRYSNDLRFTLKLQTDDACSENIY